MLRDLAGLLGVQSSYTDFYGNVHEVPDATLHALIQSMGYRLKDQAAAERLARRLEKRAPLEPVYFVDAATPHNDCVSFAPDAALDPHA